MTQIPLAAQLSYASVDRGDGTDPRPDALRLLRGLRVLSALRDARAEWSQDDEEAVVVVALDDQGRVLTLTEQDTIAPGPRVPELREQFEEAGLALYLDDPDDEYEEFDEGEESDEGEAAAEDLDEDEPIEDDSPDDDGELSEEELAELFKPVPVRVRELSHRGPLASRLRATSTGVEVAHSEVGDWSLAAYETTEPTPGLMSPSRAELPLVVLNLPADGGAWLEVTTHGSQLFPASFWPDSERGTELVLDLDTITVPATREVYRTLFIEGDGVRAELEEVAQRCILDVERAHLALRAEALGGVVGADERLQELLGAFGIPRVLVAAALSDSGVDGLDQVRRFSPKGWPRTVADALVAGTADSTPLTRRSRPLARAARVVRDRPLLGTAIAVGELAAGLLLTRVLPGGWKAVGVAVVVDATVDLGISLARTRTDKTLPPTAG